MRRSLIIVALLAARVVAQPPEPPKDATPLPAAPKADPKSTHKDLQPTKNVLIMETKPDGTKRVLIAAEVCLREGPLEVFACKVRTKEHESILRMDLDARFVHAAMEAAGAKAGSPVQFFNVKTEKPEYKAATGTKIDVKVHYTRDGKAYTHIAQEWVTDGKTKKAMAHSWVFAGSRFVKNFDDPTGPPYYTANNGEIISISNFPDAMLDLPVEISKDDSQLEFSANTEKIPPLTSKVWLILEPVIEKKK